MAQKIASTVGTWKPKEMSAVVTRCGCAEFGYDPFERHGWADEAKQHINPCPNPKGIEDLGVIAIPEVVRPPSARRWWQIWRKS